MGPPPPAAKLYQYTTLKSSSAFRLLKLLRGSSPNLECELASLSLQHEHPPYEALSYAWGGSELVEQITLDGKPFWITDNLHAALQSLRWTDRDRVLWIDAICINQGDKVEQGQQVRQMGQIYEKAEKVLVWLGKATAQIITLMETLKNLEQEVPEDWPSGEDHTIGLQQLLNRAWFTRVWILQEVAKARKADVCCGTRSIAAETFALAPPLFNQKARLHCQPVLELMIESTQASSQRAQRSDLRNLLREFKASKATDERDKIYALLGLSSDPFDTQDYQIDYLRPTSQVLHEAVLHLLDSTYKSPSQPFTFHEILNLMSCFATLDVTYWVSEPGLIADDILPPLHPGFGSSDTHRPVAKSTATAGVNNPANLLFEERSTKDLDAPTTCYTQIIQLMLDEQSGKILKKELNGYTRCTRMYSWGNEENHVKVVVVHNKVGAIMKAAIIGYTQLVRQLLHVSLGKYREEEHESCALQAAVGNQKAMKTLLDAGADVNAQGGDYGNALQAATAERQGSKEVVKLLLKAGADVNAQGGKYGNALQIALGKTGGEDVVELLLQAGAKVNAQGY